MNKTIALLATITGTGILVTPFMGWEAKIVTSAIAATPGLMYVYSDRGKKKGIERTIEELAIEIKRLNDERMALVESNGQLEIALDTRSRDLENREKAIELRLASLDFEIEKKKAEAQSEIDAAIERACSLESATDRELEQLRSNNDMELDRLKAEARAQVERETENKRQEAIAAKRRIIEEAKLEAAQLLLEQQATLASLEAQKKQIEDERKTLENEKYLHTREYKSLERRQTARVKSILSRIAARREALVVWKADMEAALRERELEIALKEQDFARSLLTREQAFKEQLQAIQEEARAKFETELEEEGAAMEEELNGQLEAALASEKKRLKKEYESAYQEWLQPQLVEIERLKGSVKTLEARLKATQEELLATRSPKIPKGWGEKHVEISRAFLTFYKERQVFLDYYSSLITEQGEAIVQFIPWRGVKEKDITKHFSELKIDMRLLDAPELGIGVESFYVKLKPSSMYVPTWGDEQAVMWRQSQEYLTEGDSFPLAPPTAPAEIFQRAVDKMDYTEKVNYMMSYRPPDRTLGKPVTTEPTEDELTRIDWLWNWRAIATKNRDANIQSINAIIPRVYGVSIGGGTEQRDPVLGESLRERVHRILEQLGIDAKTR